MPTLYAALDDRLLVVRGERGVDGSTSNGAAAGDGGATGDWSLTETLAGHEFECVAASPGAPDRIFAGTVDSGLQRSEAGEFYALTNHGLFGSVDAARSWERLQVEWPAAYESKVGRGLTVV